MTSLLFKFHQSEYQIINFNRDAIGKFHEQFSTSNTKIDQSNPHYKFIKTKKIYDNVLDAIGHTPMIRLNRIPKEFGLKCEVLVKCEFVNVGGSIKDRIGIRMVADAELSGRLTPGKSIVEATSGNTGVGLALVAAIKGYPLYITMADKCSQEKQDILIGLGAKVIRTPSEVASMDPESMIQVAKRISMENPNYVLLDQYSNPSNPLAHYDGTAEEILWQCDDRLNAVIMSTGTGGTITGVGKKIHERLPNCKVIGVDPYGSELALPAEINTTDVKAFKIEGIGYDFIPKVLDQSQVDYWIKTYDKESFLMARKLIAEEGLLCGGSSGSAVYGAMVWAKEQNFTEADRIVIVLPDNIRNYMTKHLNKTWMIENRFIDYNELKEEDHPLNGKLISSLNLPSAITLDIETATVSQCLELLRKEKGVPLMKNGKIFSVMFQRKIMFALSNKTIGKDALARKAHSKDFVVVPSNLDLAQLERIVERHDIVFVQDGEELKYVTAEIVLSQY